MLQTFCSKPNLKRSGYEGESSRGAGGTQIWFWQGCAADDAKPLPVFRGNFGRKWYPFLGIFLPKIQNLRPVFRDFIPNFWKIDEN